MDLHEETPVVTTLVVAREDDGLPKTTVAETPGSQPNVIIQTIRPFALILVRAARTYLQTLSGLLGAGLTGTASGVLPVGDFYDLLRVSAGLSVAPAVASIIQNTIELLARIDQSHPALHG